MKNGAASNGHILRVSGGDLRARRDQAGITLREAARAAVVHHRTLARYETGLRDAPQDVVDRLSRLYDAPTAEQRVLDFFADGQALTRVELRKKLRTASERRVVESLIEQGVLEERDVLCRDSRNRVYARPGVRLAGSAPEVERQFSWIRTGAELRFARKDEGISAKELASRLRVSRRTLYGWEGTAPPRGRLEEIFDALVEPASGTRLGEIRLEANWTISKLAKRAGVAPSTASAWEKGFQAVLPTHRPRLLIAIEEMKTQAFLLELELSLRIEEFVIENPGVSIRAVNHRFRRKEGEKRVEDLRVAKAIRLGQATAKYRVVAELRPDSIRRQRKTQCIYRTSRPPFLPRGSPEHARVQGSASITTRRTPTE